ncbi:nitrogen fixation protein NifQ [Vibrio sp. RC27]
MIPTNALHLFWRPIISQYLAGHTALPPFIGLEEAGYHKILARLDIKDISRIHALPARRTRGELMEMRLDECQQVYELLYQHINASTQDLANDAETMAQVITAACMSGSHLWHDLGLPERARLGQLFKCYFPSLYQLNNQNMRWKRFLYKQLCENGGDYVCRSPSCDTCSSYSECFITDVAVDIAS